MSEGRLERGILDTSVVIDLEHIDVAMLPRSVAVTSITMAELAAGPHATADAARAYGRIYAAVAARGRKAGGARAVDLLIAAVAASNGLPLCTRNPEDFAGLDDIVTVVSV